MIRLLRSLAIAGGLLVAAIATPASAGDRAITKGAVNLRAGPGPGFAKLATIPAGASLWVDFCQSRWCSVIWHKRSGWVAASYLSIRYERSAPTYDDYDYYYYEYGYGPDYGWPYYLPYPPHHHHPKPHCKPGDDCWPPHCKGKDCGPWPKPDKPPTWHGKPPKFDGSIGGDDNPPKRSQTFESGNPPTQWKFEGGDGPRVRGDHIQGPADRSDGGGSYRGRGRGGKIWEDN